LLFQGCFSAARNPDNNAYYDGFHESSAVEIKEIEKPESEYQEPDETVKEYNYYYDPYYMNRFNMMRYDNAWYWRSMYRPYHHRYDTRFSFYFGYNQGPVRYYGYDNYYYYDPFYDYAYDFYYYDDFYYPFYSSYPGYFYQPHTHYTQRQIRTGSGNSQGSNPVRKYNRLRHTGSTTSVNNPNPVPYYIPIIKTITTTEKGNSKTLTVKKSKSRGTKELNSRSSSRKSKEVTRGSKKTVKVKSSSHRGRSGKSRVKKSSSSSKSDSGNKSDSTKRDGSRK